MTPNSGIKKKIILESFLAFFIAISPLLWYLYKYIDVSDDGNWYFLWFTFTPNGFKNVGMALYFYSTKFIPLTLLIIWFATCKHWWYHVLLIPIAMFAFQGYMAVLEDTSKVDENELLYLLGVCMVVIPVVYLIRLKLVDKHVHGIDLEAMDEELKAYREKERQQKELQEKKL